MLFSKSWIFLAFLLYQVCATPSTKDCGGLLTSASGFINTPNYPHFYPHEKACKWVIEAPVGHVVRLNFLDFDVEDFDGDCDTDEVHVRNGENESGPLLFNNILCGQTIPETATSSGRYMYISFSSDFMSFGGRGFNASYTTEPAGKVACLSNACGGTFEDTSSCKLQSPGYPSGYAANLTCSWLIKAPKESDKVSFTFHGLGLENANSACAKNNVTLYDGNSAQASVIYESVCDLIDNRLTDKILKSTGPYLYIRLRTSAASTDNQGFGGRFDIVSDESATKASTLPTTTISTVLPEEITTVISTTVVKLPSSTRQLTPKPKLDEKEATEAAATSTVAQTTKAIESNPLADNPAALSGVVVGAIVAGALVILAILLVAAYVHWKRQNKRFNLRFREEDARSDVNTLISSTDSRDFEDYKKQNGKIVITAETELMC